MTANDPAVKEVAQQVANSVQKLNDGLMAAEKDKALREKVEMQAAGRRVQAEKDKALRDARRVKQELVETERAGQDHSEDESDNEVSEEEEEGGEEDGDTDGEDDDNDDDPEAKVGLSRAERTQRMQSQSQVLASSPALRKLCGASYATVHPEGETLESLFAPRSPLLVFKQPLLEALFDRYAGGKGLLSSSKFFQLMTDMSLFRPNEKERSQSLYQQVCMSRMDGRMHFGLFCGALAQLAQQRKSVV